MDRFFPTSLLHYALPWLLVLSWPLNSASPNPDEYQTYIIHMDHSQKPESFSTHELWHQTVLTLLSSLCADDKETFLYSYSYVMHGFSARLTPCQLSYLEKNPAHRSTNKEMFGKLFTTHSTNFLGLKHSSGIWPVASYGKDVIIGIIDTGIWPESESFRDHGMSAVPTRWNGKCDNGTSFSPSLCNNKLIGARSFSKGLLAAGRKISKEGDFDSPRDYEGHGTHTSSTAAGNYVVGASHFGYARGTARGVAPNAHIAMYKVLWATDTLESAASDVLAGMDQAVADGVDIMSLSLGFPQTPYFKDVIAIASLSAIGKGIFVVCAAGNDGPVSNTTYNGAPWIMTVGAGTIDRGYIATLKLGNGLSMEGTSYFPQSILVTNTPLYYGNTNISKACSSLDSKEVTGKVVLCDSAQTDPYGQFEEVRRAGAYAGIFLTDSLFLDPEDYSLPGLLLPTSSGNKVREYAMRGNATVNSMRFLKTRLGTEPAPKVAYFSSRGPDPITPDILKPDVLAPGVDILAAISPVVPFMEVGMYELVTDYALFSGTSMAAPHVAGAAALLKAVHHDWSPAAIRSALMTTATTMDNTLAIIEDQQTGLHATPLEFGAGHINPNNAMEPGLIYDMDLQDYIPFLCSLGYSKKQLSALLRQNEWSCRKNHTDLNYPSFIATFSKNSSFPTERKFSRTVTNVGDATSVYHAVLTVPKGMSIKVEPSTLTFTSKHEKQSFEVVLKVVEDAPSVNYGYLKWIDQKNHIVSSPIVATFG